MQLVPFGEYVPMRAVLGYFVNRIVVGMGEFVPGREHTLFDVKGAKLAVLICYESVFPNLTREAVAAGADMLVNITNDAWYGDSSAPYQLLAMAVDALGRNPHPDDSRGQYRNQRGDNSDRRDYRAHRPVHPRHRNRDGELEQGTHGLHAVGDLFAEIMLRALGNRAAMGDGFVRAN